MDMKLGRLFWEITGDTSKFLSELAKADARVQAVGSAWQKVGSKASLFITAPLLGIGTAAIKSAADLEQNRIAFETMLGSAEAAQGLLKDIERFAAATPFEMPGLVTGAKRLIAFGVSAGDVVAKLTNLGNAAGGNQDQLDRLILAYGKLQAKGRASLEELNMFTEAGVPVIKELQKQYGVTEQELFKLITTGKVGFADVDRAITSLTTGTGRFAGMIEKQSKSFSGVLSTFKDNLSLAGRSLVEGFLPPLTELLVKATKVAEGFAALDDDTKRLIVGLAALAAGAGPLIAAVGTAIKVFGSLKLAILTVNAALAANPFVAAATAIVAAGLLIGKAISDIKKVSDELRDSRTFDMSDSFEENSKKLAAFKAEVQGAFDRAAQATGRQRDFLRAAAEDLAAQYRQFEAQVQVQELQAEKMEGLRRQAAETKELEAQKTLEMQKQVALQEDLAERVEKRYVDARAKVLDILDSEKTEYQRIQEQIEELEATPWAKGKLEEDRLAAIEVLRARQGEVLEEEAADQERQWEETLAAEAEALNARSDLERKAAEDEIARQEAIKQSRLDAAYAWLGIATDLDAALDQFGENELARMEQEGATEEEIAKRKKELEVEAFKRKKLLNLAGVAIDTAAAIVGFLKDPGGLPGIALSAAAGVTGALQAAAILAEPVPALAEGGVVLPRPGGRLVRVAEAGAPEAVIPLDGGGMDAVARATGQDRVVTVPVELSVDGLKGLMYATINVGLRNGEVVVDARKVTNLESAMRGAR